MEHAIYNEIFDYPINEFKNHFENPVNERIIFSGKYGIGKTSFIDNYFNNIESNKSSYDLFRLFPVNYSVSSNEDIIRYIKYDLLLELLLKRKSLEDFDLRYLDTLHPFIKKNLFKVISCAITMIPKVGKNLSDIFEKIEDLKEKFIEFHNDYISSPGDVATEYLERIEMQDGSIYESDVITKIISDTIEKEKTKKSVLVVDDIDRLDPDHVFRILNIFAAHFERPGTYQKNKFNFDKVIIVCDFSNIRKLFHHRYGHEADFSGYIDKFFSSEIYFFDNKEAITKIMGNIFKTITFSTKGKEPTTLFSQHYFMSGFISNFAILLLNKNLISLRNILKLSNKHISYHYQEIKVQREIPLPAFRFFIAPQIKLATSLIGDYQSFINVLTICKNSKYEISGFEHFFGQFLHFLSFDLDKSDRYDVVYTYRDHKVLIEATRNFSSEAVTGAIVYEHRQDASTNPTRGHQFRPTADLFWHAFIDSTIKMHSMGYL